jgi:hypothetical protein
LIIMVLGAGGEVGGFALDLTVVGGAIGVPVNVLSAGAITGGGALAYEGLTTWMTAMAKYLTRRLTETDYQRPEGPNPAYPPHDKRAFTQ